MSITELVPHGGETPVTNANREEYIAPGSNASGRCPQPRSAAHEPRCSPHRYTKLYAEHLLVKSVQPAFDAFQKG